MYLSRFQLLTPFYDRGCYKNKENVTYKENNYVSAIEKVGRTGKLID